MPISPLLRCVEDALIQLHEKGEDVFELLSSLNDNIDKENYQIQMDVKMKEKTDMKIVFSLRSPVSYQKVLHAVQVMQPVSWSISSHAKIHEDPSSEKWLELTMKVASV